MTCGNFPLESSFQKVPRCVYTSTSLFEYRGWDSKAANSKHRRFTWGLRSMEVRFWCFMPLRFASFLSSARLVMSIFAILSDYAGITPQS